MKGLCNIVALAAACILVAPLLSASQVGPISQTVRNLRQTPFGEFPEPAVPPAARPLIKALKHQLRDLILETLNSPEGDAKKLQQVRSSEFLFLQPCEKPAGRWQIGLKVDSKEGLTGKLFFNVSRKADAAPEGLNRLSVSANSPDEAALRAGGRH